MAQSQNTKVEYVVPATMFTGMDSYGKMMVGDKAVEFYNDRNVEDYVQIPWDEIDYVAASVLFKGKRIARFVIRTKGGQDFSFSTRDNKATLRAFRPHVGDDKLVRSLSFLDVTKAGVRSIFHRH